MKSFTELRDRYPLFSYHGYHMEETPEEVRFWYNFEIAGLASFQPTWTIEKRFVPKWNERDEVIQKLVFSIGMVELSSYWKITCSPLVEIHAAGLDEDQIAWWKKQYYWGLGEFFYTNGIDISLDEFMHIKTLGNHFSAARGAYPLEGCLIPVGGGKDSIVTMELLKQIPGRQYAYVLNNRGATQASVDTAGFSDDQVVKVRRTLDPRMLELNRQGYLNGHTPFSALVAFSATLFAYVNRLQYVVLSNEDSANESTVAGTLINHQYSKSFDFENDFHHYEKQYVGSGVYYFSLLRGWSEFQIAREFARHSQYFSVFRSCNAGSKQDAWCCLCPKCLFVYLILSPFIDNDQLKAMFGEDLLEKQELYDNLEKLIGYQKEKPFECVGSRAEINTAICLTIQAIQARNATMPPLLAHYMTLPQYEEYRNQENRYTNYFNEHNLIPKQFLPLVKEGIVCRPSSKN